MKFKKGDIVRVVTDLYNDQFYADYKDELFYVDYCDTDYVYISISGYTSPGGWNFERFRKVSKYHLTKKEKFKLIKQKLGVRDECQKKQKK